MHMKLTHTAELRDETLHISGWTSLRMYLWLCTFNFIANTVTCSVLHTHTHTHTEREGEWTAERETHTLEAFLTVDSLCAITTTVRPSMARSMASWTRCSLSASKALVAWREVVRVRSVRFSSTPYTILDQLAAASYLGFQCLSECVWKPWIQGSIGTCR